MYNCLKLTSLNTNICDWKIFLIDYIPISPVPNYYEYRIFCTKFQYIAIRGVWDAVSEVFLHLHVFLANLWKSYFAVSEFSIYALVWWLIEGSE